MHDDALSRVPCHVADLEVLPGARAVAVFVGDRKVQISMVAPLQVSLPETQGDAMPSVKNRARTDAAAIEVLHVTVIPPVRPGGAAIIVRRAVRGHAAVVVEVI